DTTGRDGMARVLYGGRVSLGIGIGSAAMCCLFAMVFALLAGFFRGATDAVLSRVMDLIWAFPVYLLAILLATVLLSHATPLLNTRPGVAIAPGVMIVLTVLSLNVLGDGLRDALDPRAKIRAKE